MLKIDEMLIYKYVLYVYIIHIRASWIIGINSKMI